jgi:hypothetical protein
MSVASIDKDYDTLTITLVADFDAPMHHRRRAGPGFYRGGVATMATLGVRSRSIAVRWLTWIPLNHTASANLSELTRTLLRVDKLGVTGSSPVPPIKTLQTRATRLQGRRRTGSNGNASWSVVAAMPDVRQTIRRRSAASPISQRPGSPRSLP